MVQTCLNDCVGYNDRLLYILHMDDFVTSGRCVCFDEGPSVAWRVVHNSPTLQGDISSMTWPAPISVYAIPFMNGIASNLVHPRRPI